MTSRLTIAVIAVTMVLAAAGCTSDDPPADATPSSAAPGNAGPALTFEEAYRKLPMEGTKDLPITWDLAGAPDTDEVLAARRSLVFNYWELSSIDWVPVIPIGRFVYTERYYQEFLAPYATASGGNPSIGPIWVKVMGVEKTGTDQATVTFCTDLGYWHGADQKSPAVREGRANLESHILENVRTGDGERRWLVDRLIDKDGNRQAQYGADCAKWARHRP